MRRSIEAVDFADYDGNFNVSISVKDIHLVEGITNYLRNVAKATLDSDIEKTIDILTTVSELKVAQEKYWSEIEDKLFEEELEDEQEDFGYDELFLC